MRVGEKIKNYGSAMSVGLLVVLFQYGLYVVVHLSKFVSLFSVFTRSMSALSCRFTLAANGLPLAAVGDFGELNCQLSTNFDRCTELQLSTLAPIVASGCWVLAFLYFSCIALFSILVFKYSIRAIISLKKNSKVL